MTAKAAKCVCLPSSSNPNPTTPCTINGTYDATHMKVTVRIVYKALRRILAIGEFPFWPRAGKTCAVLRSLAKDKMAKTMITETQA